MLLFDFDGTITKNFEMVLSLWKEFGKKLGVKITKKQFRENNNPQWQNFVKDNFNLEIKECEEIFNKIIVDKYKKKILKEKLIPEIVEYLKNQDFGIVTSGFSPAVKNIVEKYELKPKIIISSLETGTSDKKELIKHALKKVQAEWYIGDTEQDIRAAHENNLKAIGVTWGFQNKKRLEKAKPEHIIPKPEQLINILRTLKNN